MRGKVRFKSRTRDAVTERKTSSSYGYLNIPKGMEMFKAEPDSKVRLDIMPYEVTDLTNHENRSQIEDNLWYTKPFSVHRNVGVKHKLVVCPRDFGKPCPICDYRDELVSDGYDKNKQEIQEVKTSKRNLYAVVPVGSKQYNEEVHLFDIAFSNFQEVFEEQLGDYDEFATFADLEEGTTLYVRFGSKTIGDSKPFAEATRIDFEERDKQYSWDMLQDIPKLDELFEVIDYEELKAMFWSAEVVKDEEDVEQQPTRTTERKQKTAQREEKEDDAPRRPIRRREEEPKEEPVRQERVAPREERRRTREPEKATEMECPKGHTFGVDNDEFNDCDSCPMEIWKACNKKSQENN